jgi:hypothetical protein
VTNPVSLHSFLPFSLCTIFLSSLTLSNTSSFLTRSVQLIFSILPQHHISKLSRYSSPTALTVQLSAPHNSCAQTSTLIASSLNSSSVSWWKVYFFSSSPPYSYSSTPSSSSSSSPPPSSSSSSPSSFSFSSSPRFLPPLLPLLFILLLPPLLVLLNFLFLLLVSPLLFLLLLILLLILLLLPLILLLLLLRFCPDYSSNCTHHHELIPAVICTEADASSLNACKVATVCNTRTFRITVDRNLTIRVASR